MKILLVGEYSRLHNSLQEGLRALGHQVILISTGDSFKKYPSDIIIQRSFDAGFARKLKIAIYLLFKFDITSWSMTKQFFKNASSLQGFDVVHSSSLCRNSVKIIFCCFVSRTKSFLFRL